MTKYNNKADERYKDILRYLLLVSAAIMFVSLVLGIVVRVTQTGSGCPDWPTCSGTWIPIHFQGALLPFLHRVFSLLTGILVLSASLLSLKLRKLWPGLNLILLFTLAGLVAQGLSGRSIVLYGDSPLLSGIHLGMALTVQATILVACVSIFIRGEKDLDKISFIYNSSIVRLSFLSIGTILLLFFSGAMLASYGQALNCRGWLLCNGALIPGDEVQLLHFVHRLLTGMAGFSILSLFVKTWKVLRDRTAILVTATAAGVLVLAQALMGAVETARGYPAYLTGLHVASGVGLWSTLVIFTSLAVYEMSGFAPESLATVTPFWRKGILRDFLTLTKPVVVSLLLVTTFTGMVAGARSWPPLSILVWTLIGGAMAAGGSSAINQYIDRFDDVKMQRTSRRPIPTGRLTPAEGLAFGVGLCLASFYLMVAFVNFLAAMLTLAGIIYYVVVYSLILKKATTQNIVIGGGAGAVPPLVGWAASTGSLDIPALFLFAVIFLWTPPHFWALALVRRHDYARAGVPMLPVVKGEHVTRLQIFLYTIQLVAITLVMPMFGLGGSVYLVSAMVLGGGLLFTAWKVWKGSGNKIAWQMYRHSSMYLALLFLAVVVDALL